MKYFYATGKRKTSVARVRLYPNGSGKVTINDKDMQESFTTLQKRDVLTPFSIAGKEKEFDVSVKVLGGGITGQAQAIRHGITKALLESDPTLRLELKRAGLITRDSRVKERKKPGLRRARRARQFSKR
ncbi:MAG: 30S ribosomal protein S9 [Patescibacteria group bacterium]|nr:30S ribosomal protein S9 [Patescibacteria group bacterium]